MLASQMLKIGGLPDKAHLRDLAGDGCLHLINVSGTTLGDIHGAQAVAAFTLSEYGFSDHFSSHSMVDEHFDDTPGFFLSQFVPEQQENFLKAVAFGVKSITAHKSVSIFCHYGVGRSPAVALALMRCVWHWPLPTALQAVRQIRPQAHLSHLSVSASSWVLNRLK